VTELWNIRAEIIVQPEDFPSGETNGFMNIVTWADSADAAQKKIESYFQGFDWHVVGVEEAKVLPLDFASDSDEFQDMFERALYNPDAIICGTFHGFRAN
jgi:hypothetical protein